MDRYQRWHPPPVHEDHGELAGGQPRRHPLARRGRRDRCDKIATTKLGCATYFPTRVMNFDETPVTRGP
ncbi:hypothetical protein SFR_6907 (plasmid) [Streptomyces sp. FR-008]|nr:hypothetical protein SFR_6907 [Streptomyces sp. FR-008]